MFPRSISLTNNQRLLLRRRPEGQVTPDIFELDETPLPAPRDGEFIVEIEFVSIDPAMRGWMIDAPSYIPPVALGDVMRAFAAGRVVLSRHSAFPEGCTVRGLFGAQRFAVSDGTDVRRVREDIPVSASLGVAGVTGLTAYFGLFEVGQPRPGDTVVVLGAAGAVGATVVQLAVMSGCRVIGVDGSAAKCDLVVELGAEACLDFHDSDWRKRLRRLCPAGIDVLWDNVGGPTLEAALWSIAQHGRVVLCGAMTQYNSASATGPGSYVALITQSARMQGFILQDYASGFDRAEQRLAAWLRDGRLKHREHVYDGLAATPDAIVAQFEGRNLGKTLVRLAGHA